MSESDFATFTDPSAPPPAEFWHGMTPGSDDPDGLNMARADLSSIKSRDEAETALIENLDVEGPSKSTRYKIAVLETVLDE